VKVGVSYQNVVEREWNVFTSESDSACSVALGVCIYEQGALFCSSETRGEIYRCSCFTDATFLICYCDYSRHYKPVRVQRPNLPTGGRGFHVEPESNRSTWK